MPQHHETPMLDELENGPWPSFISGLKRLATDDNPMMIDLLGQLQGALHIREEHGDLLAFALDAWWDNQSREDELRDQLEVVAREMQSAREALQRVLSVHDLNAHLAEHLTFVMSQVAEGSGVTVSDTLVGPLFPQATADVTTGSLDVFIAAGGLALIEDPGIRRDLLDWPTRIEDLLDDEVYLRNFAAADLASHLRANYAVANAELQSTPLLRNKLGGGPPVPPDLGLGHAAP